MESRKFYVRNLTPDSEMCAAMACPAIYEITPDSEMCSVLSCPAIYEITPDSEMCTSMLCPGIYDGLENDYIIVGSQIDPKEVGLEEKVGDGEVLIKISKKIIDNKKGSD